MNKIEFRPISNYEGIYEVSNTGLIRQCKTGKVTRGWKHNIYGHRKVRLYKNNIAKDFYLHRLVAYAFIEPIEGKQHINHIDSNPDNNHVTNLEWATQQDNMLHAKINNRMNKSGELILNKYTGIYYESIKQAAESICIKQNTLVYRFIRSSERTFINVSDI